MKLKTSNRTLKELLSRANIDDPEKLFRQAVCQYCGEIKLLDKHCVRCFKKKKARIEFHMKRKELGLESPWKKDPIREEYEQLFLEKDPSSPILTEREILKKKNLSVLVALVELRNCFQKNLAGEYAVPLHNQERLNRILQAIDVLQGGWLNIWLGRHRKATTVDHFITGDLGTTWHP